MEVVPEFYTRDDRNFPVAWIAKIRESMARLTPHYSSNRAVREYTEKYYVPAAEGYKKRAENNGALAKQIVDWQLSLDQNWKKLGFSDLRIETGKDHHLFEVQVNLNNLDHTAIKVELYSTPLTKEMDYQGQVPNTPNSHIYRVEVPSTYPASSFTPRIVPYFPGVAVPLEANEILWQR